MLWVLALRQERLGTGMGAGASKGVEGSHRALLGPYCGERWRKPADCLRMVLELHWGLLACC